MNSVEFMSEFYQIVLDAVKKQGFTVVLLLGAVFVVGHRLSATETEYRGEIKTLRDEVQTCHTEREELAVKVARMETQLSGLINQAEVKQGRKSR